MARNKLPKINDGQIIVRMPLADIALIRRMAGEQNMNVSQFVRWFIAPYRRADDDAGNQNAKEIIRPNQSGLGGTS